MLESSDSNDHDLNDAINHSDGADGEGMNHLRNKDAEENFLEEMKKLQNEREKILADAERQESKRFRHIECQLQMRVKIAADYQDLQLKNLYDHYLIDVQQASNEFERGKRRLQSTMLDISAARRRRLDSLRVGAVVKRKRRGRGGAHDRTRLRAATKSEPFIMSLERQGVVRVALTPDEVNADLEVILRAMDSRGMDSTRINGSPALFVERPSDANGKNGEKVHSSRGILHYHDTTFEKGDRVSVFTNGRPKSTLRYTGVVLSVNAKELQIRTDDASQYRLLVGQLCSGRYLMKAASS